MKELTHEEEIFKIQSAMNELAVAQRKVEEANKNMIEKSEKIRALLGSNSKDINELKNLLEQKAGRLYITQLNKDSL